MSLEGEGLTSFLPFDILQLIDRKVLLPPLFLNPLSAFDFFLILFFKILSVISEMSSGWFGMKKAIILSVMALMFWTTGMPLFAGTSSAATPVIFFSDLTSGPNSGGKDNNGVFVTVIGKNFGASRGSSTVTVGGGEAAAYAVWTDTSVTFQLGSKAATGDIAVVTPAGTSNGIHFTVRNGRIYFVDANSKNTPGSGTYDDPWRSPHSFFTAQQPGDTCYFRAGTYTGQYGSTSRAYNVSFYNTGAPSGAQDNEIAWVGYPGETALFKADDNTVFNGAFEFSSNNQYYIVAGLSIYGRGDGREQVRLYSDNDKLVNCKIEGIKTLSYAMIGVVASNIKIWGNECFGAKSGNKLDHIMYFQETSHSNNVDIGWNYIHDNNIAMGPVFSWNLGNGETQNINIHDNTIDCRNSANPLRLAGIWGGRDGSVTFANNLIIGAGAELNNDPSYNVIYCAFGKVTVVNNTFYLSHGAGSNYVVNIYGGASADVRNNIFYNDKNISYVNGNATVDSNLYHGGAGNPPAGDHHAILDDPQFVDPSAMDFHVKQNSPVKGKGSDTSSVCPKDHDGKPRGPGSTTIGAYQDPAEDPPAQPPSNGNSTETHTQTTTSTPDTSIASTVGTGTTTPTTPPATLPADSFQGAAAGQIKVVGGTASKGTVNPAKGETAKIYFQGSASGRFECRIFTLAGESVWESSMDNVQSGMFEWVPGSVASGIYLVNIKGPGLKATQKIAIIK